MKGQAAIEFMIYVCILMLILAMLFWNNASVERRVMGIKTVTEAENFCNSISVEINNAVRSGDGYSREFYVPDNFFGVSSFVITVGNYSVYMTWMNNSASSSIIIKNLTNTNAITPGLKFIENKGGNIYVTSI